MVILKKLMAIFSEPWKVDLGPFWKQTLQYSVMLVWFLVSFPFWKFILKYILSSWALRNNNNNNNNKLLPPGGQMDYSYLLWLPSL